MRSTVSSGEIASISRAMTSAAKRSPKANP
jgi:hypothetical protein